MIFSSFFEEFPHLVESEFRNIFIVNNGVHHYIPAGNYAFLELFCPDIDCDCRKVIINVVSSAPPKRWAILNYGWETEKYYKTWWGTSHKHYQPMSGIMFDPPTQDPLQNEFLTVFRDLIRHDKNYAQRIQTHYWMFKEKMREKDAHQAMIQKLALNAAGEKARRNDPCDSGKKFKKCCLLTVSTAGEQ